MFKLELGGFHRFTGQIMPGRFQDIAENYTGAQAVTVEVGRGKTRRVSFLCLRGVCVELIYGESTLHNDVICFFYIEESSK